MIINLNFNRRAMLSICFSLISLVALTFIYTLWQWRQDWLLAHYSVAPQTTVATVDESAKMIAEIPSSHLFGQSFSNGSVPITNLQLRVIGIVKVDNEIHAAASKAYISISGQPGKIFQVGDNLPYGVKVYEITPNAVILQNDGRLEKLPLPREKLKFREKIIQESS